MDAPTGPTRIAELRMSSPDAQESDRFLREWLPAVANPPAHSAAARVSFVDEPGRPIPQANERGAYWKISVADDDLDATASALVAGGVAVTEPQQFLDIGYLAHLHEPGGTAVELVQRTFDRPRSPPPPPAEAQLALITLRATDREAYERFLAAGLGLSLVATMAVEHGGPDPFDLSFWGFIDPDASGRPNPDPASVENREWLYQLPLTVIELQHHRTPISLAGASPLVDIAIEVETDAKRSELAARLAATGVACTAGEDQSLRFASPDGHQFTVRTPARGDR
ncbi:MAG: hypothetical protein ACR2QO_05810 [Acidimicrobiales bacterium]